jgi:hypothetical protein
MTKILKKEEKKKKKRKYKKKREDNNIINEAISKSVIKGASKRHARNMEIL